MKKRKNRKRLITRKIKRGSLILYALDGIKREYFNVIKRELKDVLENYSGVYALYKGDKLVYSGLATNLYWRMKGHSKAKRFDWNTASLFVIPNLKYLRDVETAVVRIAKPKHNDVRGRVKDEHYLERLLNKRVRAKKKKLRYKSKAKDRELKELEREIKIIKDTVN